jgi:hypothetical protein
MDFNGLIFSFPDLVVGNICTPHLELSENFKFSCTSKATRLLACHDIYWINKLEHRLWKLDSVPIEGAAIKNTWTTNSSSVLDMSVKELRREMQGRGLCSSGHFEKAGLSKEDHHPRLAATPDFRN